MSRSNTIAFISPSEGEKADFRARTGTEKPLTDTSTRKQQNPGSFYYLLLLDDLITWLLDYLIIWLLDYLITWLLDYLITWLLDYLITWLLFWKSTYRWFLDWWLYCLQVLCRGEGIYKLIKRDPTVPDEVTFILFKSHESGKKGGGVFFSWKIYLTNRHMTALIDLLRNQV